MPPRLQRILLQLKQYDMSVKHVPGKNIPVADTLSRKSVPDTYPGLIEGMDSQVHAVLANLPVSDRKLQEIANLSEQEKIQLLKETILKGWPSSKKKCPHEIAEFWNYRDELTIADSIILKGSKAHYSRGSEVQDVTSHTYWSPWNSEMSPASTRYHVLAKHISRYHQK